ncbi:MAG: class I SAM-dependent methyltransferase [Bacteroidota bacterium]
MSSKTFGHTAKYWAYRMGSAWRYYKGAKTRYDLHSPSLVAFQQAVLQTRIDPQLEALVQDFRRWYAQQDQWIDTTALGAGSWIRNRPKRRLNELVSHSAISSRSGQLLARLANFIEAETIVELGTNGGISTAYLAYGRPGAQVISIEGNEQLAHSTRESLRKWSNNAKAQQATLTREIKIITGTFAEQLPDLVKGQKRIDLLFIDGDHRYAATLDYVRTCLPRATKYSVFVIADIRWSEGMERAWTELQSWPEVSATVATYHFGFLFFNEDMRGLPPLDFIGARWKPWRMGFW